MVKVAVAGGSSTVAREVIDALVSYKYDVLVLSRSERGAVPEGVDWARVDYQDSKQLEKALDGIQTVLSFIVITDKPSREIQKNLIDAAVRAGVKRFAPSDWATSDLMPWYSFKEETRRYLEELNREQTVLEYTLFQPGLFMNYLTYPYKSAAHLHQTELPSSDYLAQVVAKAIVFEGKWPVVGGIGSDASLKELIALGESAHNTLGDLRPGGEPFHIQVVKKEDLESREWPALCIPQFSHPSIPPEYAGDWLSKAVFSDMLLGISAGCFKVSDEWNRLLPDCKLTSTKEFLMVAWAGKP